MFIGAAALWWATHNINLPALLHILKAVSPGWVAAAVGSVLAVAAAKTARWAALYGPGKPQIPFGHLFSILVAAQMVNLVIPIRAGELVRIGLMKQQGQPATTTFTTIVVEKTIDLAAAGLAGTLLGVLALAPPWLSRPMGSLLPLSATLVVALAAGWRLRSRFHPLLARAIAPVAFLSTRWQRRLLNSLDNTLAALETLANVRTLGYVLFWTLLIWLFSLLTVAMLFAAFNLQLPLAAAVLIVLAINFSNIAPSPPALIGVMHGIAVAVLGQYGAGHSVALSFGIVLNVVTVLPLLLLGAGALWLRTLSMVTLLRHYTSNKMAAE